MSPYERTVKKLKADGWTRWEKSEKVVPRTRTKQDFFGGDIVAVRPGRILSIQVTDGPHGAQHVSEALQDPAVWDWIDAGGEFEIWAWRKLKTGWEPKITRLLPEMAADCQKGS